MQNMVALMAEGRLDSGAPEATLRAEYPSKSGDRTMLGSYFSTKLNALRKAGRSISLAAQRLNVGLTDVTAADVACLLSDDAVLAALASVQQRPEGAPTEAFLRNALKIKWPRATARSKDAELDAADVQLKKARVPAAAAAASSSSAAAASTAAAARASTSAMANQDSLMGLAMEGLKSMVTELRGQVGSLSAKVDSLSRRVEELEAREGDDHGDDDDDFE